MNRNLFFYQGGKLTTVVQPKEIFSLVRGRSILNAQLITGEEGSSLRMLAVDGNQSVLQAICGCGLITNCYAPYGFRAMQGSSCTQPKFNGEWQDFNSEAYLLGNGHRAYSTRLFRCHSPDRLSPFGKGGRNAYVYCTGDPINKTDPSGRVGIKRSYSMPANTSEFQRVAIRTPSLPELRLDAREPKDLFFKVLNTVAADGIFKLLDNTDVVSLSRASRSFHGAITTYSLKKSSYLSGSNEILSAGLGEVHGVLPVHALQRARELYPHYDGTPGDLLNIWKMSKAADDYSDITPRTIIGRDGSLNIRQGEKYQRISPN